MAAFVVALVLILTKPNYKTGGTTTEPTEQTDPYTDTYLVQDGKSDYVIVIPENASDDIIFAKNDLINFFAEATGIVLPARTDTGLTFDETAKYLSIGNTTIFQGSGVSADREELGQDGLRLVTKGDTVIMAGGSDKGAMYAMYEFLERTFNLEVYAEDEWYIDTNVQNIRLKEFNVTEIPSFERRSVGLFPFSVSEVFRNRMRQELYNDGWILWSHSHFKILPPETYQDAHPEWYKDNQLCLYIDEMRQEFTKNVIELIKANPNYQYIMLGQEDYNTFCITDENREEVEKYRESGAMMHFINKVADDVQAYLDEYEPGRIVYLGTFGYHKTQYAPVKLNENGEYEPIDETVIPRPNVYIMVAPIYAANNYNYYHEVNQDVQEILKGWKAVAQGQMFTWIYNKIFGQYFIPFHNFSTLVQNYEILYDLGSRFVYHQGNKETPTGGLNELMSYVEAKLMWNHHQDPYKLAYDFIDHYYKDAAPFLKEYFDLIRFNYAMWEQLYDFKAYNNGSRASEIFSTKYWTRDLLDQFNEIFNNALSSVEHYQETNPELYNKLVLRIKKEKLTVDYLYLSFYFDEFDYDTASVMINDFERTCSKLGIEVWRERYMTSTDSTITGLVANWRTKLQQK